MKFLLLAGLLACACANAIQKPTQLDEDECDLGELACLELAPMPELGSTYSEMTDDLLNKLVEQKLKGLKWLVGKIPAERLKAFISEFITKHRAAVVDALKQGGRKLVSMLSQLVKKFWEKVKNGSVKNWVKDKWNRLKEKFGDEEMGIIEELEPMPWIGSTYFELTDDQLNWLVEQKLKGLKWLVAKIPAEKIKAFISEFITKHRAAVVDALKRGGLKLVSMLNDLVKKMWEKVKDGSVKNWVKDKWTRLKEKFGDEELEDEAEDAEEDMKNCVASLGEKACDALAPMPWAGNSYFLTDAMIADLIHAKLKVLQFVVGRVAGLDMERFVASFIEKHREYITEAVTKGGRKLYDALKRIVKEAWAKVKDGSVKNWVKDKWTRLKEKFGDEPLEDEDDSQALINLEARVRGLAAFVAKLATEVAAMKENQ